MLVKQTMKWLVSFSLIAMMYAYAMFQGGFVSWFLFYSVAPLIAFAFVIGLFPLKTIKVKRIVFVEPRQAGQPLQVTIEGKKSFFPLFYLIVEDQLPMKLKRQLPHRSSAKAIFFPLFKRSFSFTYTIPSLPRGEHEFSSILIKTGDLFGFIQKQAVQTVDQKILVYPQIEAIQWQAHSRARDDARIAKTGLLDASAVVGVRDYVSGDRLAWIDWKSTAKRNKLMTKQFEQRAVERTLLFLDNSKASYRSAGSALFEKAVSVAASLVSAFERSGQPFVMPFDSEIGMDERKPFSYSKRLAKIEADREESFVDAVKRFLVRCEKNSRVVLVSAHASDEMIQLMTLLAKQNIHVDFYCVTAGGQASLQMIQRLQTTGAGVHLIVAEKAGEYREPGEK